MDTKTKLLSATKSNREARSKIAKQRDLLREESYRLRQEQSTLRKEFVAESFHKFLEEMREPWKKDAYISGGYSTDFTRHVKRGRWPTLSEEHRKAQREYLEALKNLNRVFVDLCLDKPEKMLQEIQSGACLKNLS